LRTSWLFGRFGNNFLTKILDSAKNCTNLNVVTDQIANPTSCNSLAKALWQIVLTYQNLQKLTWGIYHFAEIPSCSRYDFAQKIVDLGYQLKILAHKPNLIPVLTKDYSSQTPRPLNTSLNCDLFAQTFNFKLTNWHANLTEELQCIAES